MEREEAGRAVHNHYRQGWRLYLGLKKKPDEAKRKKDAKWAARRKEQGPGGSWMPSRGGSTLAEVDEPGVTVVDRYGEEPWRAEGGEVEQREKMPHEESHVVGI